MSAPPALQNYLYWGDALDVCRNDHHAFDLVYLDPPFNVGGEFSARPIPAAAHSTCCEAEARPRRVAYRDAWGGVSGFFDMLLPRLHAIRERMSAHASLYLHLDYRTVHKAKVLCDELFGDNTFRGEIIWVPGNGGRRKAGPSLTHQTLLLYSKDRSAKGQFVWNADDEQLREPYATTSLAMHFQQKTDEGRAFRERTIAGKTYRYYADRGRRLGSVWSDIPSMSANTPLRRESTGYPTQKPEPLLRRLIRASSNEGATVGDLMCGSGTTLVVAAREGRRFVGADIGLLAIDTASNRLQREGIAFTRQDCARAADVTG